MRKRLALASVPFGVFLGVLERALDSIRLGGLWVSVLLFAGAGVLLLVAFGVLWWPELGALRRSPVGVHANRIRTDSEVRARNKRLRLIVACLVIGFMLVTLTTAILFVFVSQYPLLIWFGLLSFGATVLMGAQVITEIYRRLGIRD